MSLKLMEKEQRDNHLKKAKEHFIAAMEKNPSEVCFIVIHEDGGSTTGLGGAIGPLMVGQIEAIKFDILMRHVVSQVAKQEGSVAKQEGSDEVN